MHLAQPSPRPPKPTPTGAPAPAARPAAPNRPPNSPGPAAFTGLTQLRDGDPAARATIAGALQRQVGNTGLGRLAVQREVTPHSAEATPYCAADPPRGAEVAPYCGPDGTSAAAPAGPERPATRSGPVEASADPGPAGRVAEEWYAAHPGASPDAAWWAGFRAGAMDAFLANGAVWAHVAPVLAFLRIVAFAGGPVTVPLLVIAATLVIAGIWLAVAQRIEEFRADRGRAPEGVEWLPIVSFAVTDLTGGLQIWEGSRNTRVTQLGTDNRLSDFEGGYRCGQGVVNLLSFGAITRLIKAGFSRLRGHPTALPPGTADLNPTDTVRATTGPADPAPPGRAPEPPADAGGSGTTGIGSGAGGGSEAMTAAGTEAGSLAETSAGAEAGSLADSGGGEGAAVEPPLRLVEGGATSSSDGAGRTRYHPTWGWPEQEVTGPPERSWWFGPMLCGLWRRGRTVRVLLTTPTDDPAGSAVASLDLTAARGEIVVETTNFEPFSTATEPVDARLVTQDILRRALPLLRRTRLIPDALSIRFKAPLTPRDYLRAKAAAVRQKVGVSQTAEVVVDRHAVETWLADHDMELVDLRLVRPRGGGHPNVVPASTLADRATLRLFGLAPHTPVLIDQDVLVVARRRGLGDPTTPATQQPVRIETPPAIVSAGPAPGDGRHLTLLPPVRSGPEPATPGGDAPHRTDTVPPSAPGPRPPRLMSTADPRWSGPSDRDVRVPDELRGTPLELVPPRDETHRFTRIDQPTVRIDAERSYRVRVDTDWDNAVDAWVGLDTPDGQVEFQVATVNQWSGQLTVTPPDLTLLPPVDRTLRDGTPLAPILVRDALDAIEEVLATTGNSFVRDIHIMGVRDPETVLRVSRRMLGERSGGPPLHDTALVRAVLGWADEIGLAVRADGITVESVFLSPPEEVGITPDDLVAAGLPAGLPRVVVDFTLVLPVTDPSR